MSSNSDLISREAVIQLSGPVSRVFPLFEPINEKLWVANWNPRLIYPSTGEVCEDMVFTTRPRFAGEVDYTWILTRLDRTEHRVQYSVSTPERIWFVKVHCMAAGAGTRASIRYSYLGLTADGHRRNVEALDQMFAEGLRDWESALNRYLARPDRGGNAAESEQP